MGASCRGVCTLVKKNKVPNSLKYQFGLKRCSWCEVWIVTDQIRCECCKMILRTKSRNKKKSSTKNKINDFGQNATLAA